jgi:hypothetical protein
MPLHMDVRQKVERVCGREGAPQGPPDAGDTGQVTGSIGMMLGRARSSACVRRRVKKPLKQCTVTLTVSLPTRSSRSMKARTPESLGDRRSEIA